MTTLAKLTVDLLAGTAAFRADMDKAAKTASSFGLKMKGMAKTSADAFLNLNTAMIAIGTGAALYGIKQAYENTDEIRKQGEMIGVSADEWGRYSYAAKIAGVDNDQLTDAFKDLGVKITDAAKTGSGPMVDFFTQINGSARDWAAMSPDEQFRKFSEELNKMTDSDARFYLDEVNDSAYSLFQTIKSGELLRLTDEAERLGLSLNSVQFEAISDTRKELQALASTGAGIWQQVLAAAAPALSAVSSGIRQWIVNQAEAAGGFQQLGIIIVETVLQAIIDVAQALENVLNTTYREAEKLAAMMGKTLNPDRASLERQLESISKQMGILYQNATKIAGLGDAPPMAVFSEEEQAKVDKLTATASRLRQELNAPINFAAGLESQVNNIVAQIRSVKTEIAIPANMPTFGSTAIPGVTLNEPGTDPTEAEKARMEAQLARLQQSFLNEQELIDLHEQQKLDQLEVWRQADIAGIENYESIKTQITQQANKEREKFDAANNRMLLGNSANLFESMADLSGTFAGEQSGLYKTMFAVSKAFSIAESIIAIQTGIAKAAATPFPANLAAMATVASATMGIVSTITGTNMQGVAHDGISSIPREGTWLLDKGERVVDSSTNADLKNYLEKQKQSNQSTNWTIIINEAPPGTTADIDEQNKTISIAVAQTKNDLYDDFTRGGPLRRALGQ